MKLYEQKCKGGVHTEGGHVTQTVLFTGNTWLVWLCGNRRKFVWVKQRGDQFLCSPPQHGDHVWLHIRQQCEWRFLWASESNVVFVSVWDAGRWECLKNGYVKLSHDFQTSQPLQYSLLLARSENKLSFSDHPQHISFELLSIVSPLTHTQLTRVRSKTPKPCRGVKLTDAETRSM